MAKKYLGYAEQELQHTLARFLDKNIKPLAPEKVSILSQAPLEWEQMPDLQDLADLEKEGYLAVENGYAEHEDGSIRVAVLTDMPGVTPQMWDWWFGWHGSQDMRYKLWHPGAHLAANWEDGRADHCYIGRNSVIKEYIGNTIQDAVIQFKSPLAFGFSKQAVNEPDKVVFICARIGHPDFPVDFGYLVHQVRATENGSEMRSRFLVGKQYISARKEGKITAALVNVVKSLKKLPKNFARDLFQHCAEEMKHLAGFLPELYQEQAKQTELAVAGTLIPPTHPDFDQVMMNTLFNKIDPGQRPALIVEPKTVEDIIHTVKYARRVGKRITVSSGGHSFSANFIRDGSILLLMKHFNQFEVNPETMTAKAGPGVGGSVLLAALYKQGLFFPAGHCKGVCIGGYLLQGGYGWNGRKTGIACQHIIGMDIVTASGELVYADETQNADLFWAARGSGPGFFGIVTCFYLKVFPLPKYRAAMSHNFDIKHLEAVYAWAHEAGPNIPKAIEFQLIMSRHMLNLFGPGIEVLAPIFADTEEEFEAAKAFMLNSPIKNKATVSIPAFNPGIEMLYKSAMTHYPSNHHWGVDNMWTHASFDDLLPFIKNIADTLPPAPSHFLWLNWYPGNLKADMAYSKEDDLYLALYSCWKDKKDTSKYGSWAAETMRKMEHLSVGIQLADEGLHKRTAHFMSGENLKKVQEIRQRWDPNGVFFEWHSKPE
jgi:FAD/FMN-containing dehydrogenase